ncbi:hypothetical protein Droror1_Dr00004283 [Drosera rotundifolia]
MMMGVSFYPYILQYPLLPTPLSTKPRATTHRRQTLTTTVTCSSAAAAAADPRLVRNLCQKGSIKEALHILTSNEKKPSQRVYEILIEACGRRNSLSDALIVHRHIIDNGLGKDPFLGTKLINLYCQLGRLDYARKSFDEIPERSIYVWNAMFHGLVLAGKGEEALGLYREFNMAGFVNDRFSYTFALKACAVNETMGSLLLDKGQEIHAHLLRRGFEVVVHVMTTLLDMYARYRRVRDAVRVFGTMPVKNVVSWSAMIACYAKNGRPLEALELFRSMMLESGDDVPNPVTMVSVIQACALLASLEQGKLVHGFILRRGLDSILPVHNALITMYARCGALSLAQRVFDMTENKDVVSWNALISSYGMHGFGIKALEVYEGMIAKGVQPTSVSFVAVLGACSHAGLVTDAKELFQSMVNEHRISPGVEHYACMVDILGRANKLDEAALIIEEIPFEPGPVVWGALLGSCKIHHNTELAERASSRLFEIEPYNAGNYAVMADIYARARMWDNVKRVLKQLEARGLERVPSDSTIEVCRKMHTFSSADKPNPATERIQDSVIKLSNDMREHGYVPNTNLVHYDLDENQKEQILLGHTGKLAIAFGLLNMKKGETMRIMRNLRLCEDCHTFTKLVSKYEDREILVRDANRFHHFRDGVCSCGDYW